MKGKNQSAAYRNLALRHARAGRILFVDLDCMPDSDVVARHAVHADRDVLVYGYRRIYPREKLFPFRDAIDYGGVFDASARGNSPVYIAPSSFRWRDVQSCCFSAPSVLRCRAYMAPPSHGSAPSGRAGKMARDLLVSRNGRTNWNKLAVRS